MERNALGATIFPTDGLPSVLIATSESFVVFLSLLFSSGEGLLATSPTDVRLLKPGSLVFVVVVLEGNRLLDEDFSSMEEDILSDDFSLPSPLIASFN
uniref:Uncharacterized protein n=1 Tax=Romanomermis culicivorax TaxID=13658 RepID=A0A915JG81_ROMCU